MSWLDKIRKPVKKVFKPVTKITEKLLKPVVKPLRPLAAAALPTVGILATGGLSLVAQPKTFGITNTRSAKIYDKSQQVSRVVVGSAAVVGSAMLLAPAAAPAAAPAVAAPSVAAEGAVTTAAVVGATAPVSTATTATGLAAVAGFLKSAIPTNGFSDPRAAGGDYMTNGGGGLTAEFERLGGSSRPLGVSWIVWGLMATLGVGILFLLFRRA